MSAIDLTNSTATQKVAVCNPDGSTPLTVTASGTAPVGGGITWGAPTAVAMTGSSKTFVPANAARKALIMWSPAGNAAAGYDLAGGTAVVATSLQLSPGGPPVYLQGAPCPVGIVTAIGTNLQNLYYQEGT